MNLDPAAVEAAITPRTKGIVAVDIFGYPCELDPLRELAEKHGLVLIQDACEALGAEYRGRTVGSHGVDAVFAFYPNKQMTTGEGGIVTTHDEETWRSLVGLRNQGRADGGGWLDHARLGFNYRIDDIRAALGIGQVEKLDTILVAPAGRRCALRRAARRHRRARGAARRRRRPCALLVRLRRRRCERGTDRERVIAELERQGIASSRYLPSIHLQAYMRERYGFREGLCPVSEDLSQRTLALPFFTRDRAAGPGARRRGARRRTALRQHRLR